MGQELTARKAWLAAIPRWWDARSNNPVEVEHAQSGDDEFYLLAATKPQLAEYRAWVLAEPGREDDGEVVFTCDDCDLASRCPFVYDDYNTGADCLAEK